MPTSMPRHWEHVLHCPRSAPSCTRASCMPAPAQAPCTSQPLDGTGRSLPCLLQGCCHPTSITHPQPHPPPHPAQPQSPHPPRGQARLGAGTPTLKWPGAAQVKAAFLAGLVVVLLLTVATRWLGLRTDAAATTQMGFKDARVKAVGELLRGMHHIKAAAWEPVFVGQVGSKCLFVRPAMMWAERCSSLCAGSGATHRMHHICVWGTR